MNIKRTSDEHQTDINKNDKKEKNEKNEKNDKETTTSKERKVVVADYKSAINFYQNNFGVINPHTAQDLQMWVNDIGIDLVLEALKRATENQKNYSYAKGIMKNWEKHNIKTLEDVEAQDVAFANKTKTGFKNKPRKQESLPDWAKEDYNAEKKEVDQEVPNSIDWEARRKRLQKVVDQRRKEQEND